MLTHRSKRWLSVQVVRCPPSALRLFVQLAAILSHSIPALARILIQGSGGFASPKASEPVHNAFCIPHLFAFPFSDGTSHFVASPIEYIPILSITASIPVKDPGREASRVCNSHRLRRADRLEARTHPSVAAVSQHSTLAAGGNRRSGEVNYTDVRPHAWLANLSQCMLPLS